jgi:hypothetical protein
VLRSVFSHHSRDCKYADERTYRRCNCPQWIGGRVNGENFRKAVFFLERQRATEECGGRLS